MMIWLNDRYDDMIWLMIDGYDMIDRYYDYHEYTIRQMDTQFVIQVVVVKIIGLSRAQLS